ncbi:hypothetical protein L596_023310 [Steinernema carpocapsae]|uniref:Fatty-acid and retinol-binding protein 1 n=1 Tax=Steinernema carpocapsae TaxID=34508 RepID=A0A4U5MDA5_STECR|nr:hypothetical protein L596_023310 [Steinernema carpocapsae]
MRNPLYFNALIISRQGASNTTVGTKNVTNLDMIRQTVLVLLLVGLVPVKALPIPTGADVYVPDELKTFFTSLTNDDLKILKELQPQLVGKDSDAAFELIKSKNEDLANRVKSVHDKIFAKISQLPEIPRNFFTNLQNFHGTDMRANFADLHEVLLAGDQLPQDAKEEIFKAFPSLRNLFESMTVKEWVKEYKTKSPQEVADLLMTQMQKP